MIIDKEVFQEALELCERYDIKLDLKKVQVISKITQDGKRILVYSPRSEYNKFFEGDD